MANELSNRTEHEKIFTLLPWFVNKTLDSDQRVNVSLHVEQCSECQSEVEFLSVLNKTVQDDAENPFPGQGDVDANLASVMSRIESEAKQTSPAASLPASLKGVLEKLFGLPATFSNAQWGATVIASLLVAVLGFQWYSGNSEEGYSVLSSSDSEDSFIRLSLDVNPTTSLDQIQLLVQSTFQGLGDPIVIQAGNDGDYLLTLKEPIGVVELNEMISNLQDEAQIERIVLLP